MESRNVSEGLIPCSLGSLHGFSLARKTATDSALADASGYHQSGSRLFQTFDNVPSEWTCFRVVLRHAVFSNFESESDVTKGWHHLVP